MTGVLLPVPFLVKELRALAPVWIATVVVALLAILDDGWAPVGLLILPLGSAALGAMAIGHEYAYQTLPLLLVQPVTRRRMLLSKLAVLLPLLVSLSALALLVLRHDDVHFFSTYANKVRWAWTFVGLTALLGLLVAPCITLVARSQMAGMVFTLAIPAALWMAGEIWRSLTLGFGTVATDLEPARRLITTGGLLASAAAGLLLAPLFARVEICAGQRVLARASRPRVATTLTRRHPLLLLAAKELRLQTMPFVVATLFALAWTGLHLAGADRHIAGQSFRAMAGLYMTILAILVGAQVYAEERALGTQTMGLLQPMAYWKGWTVKAATAITVAVTLGWGLVSVLERAMSLIERGASFGFFGSNPLLALGTSGAHGFTILLAAVVGVYSSSLCVGGMRAFITALPLAVGLAWLQRMALIETTQLRMAWETTLFRGSYAAYMRSLSEREHAAYALANRVLEPLGLFVAFGFVVLALTLAQRNYRTLDQDPRRTAMQIVGLGVYLAVATAAALGGPSLWLASVLD